MARERYLKNAPIVEAMIDFRVSLPSGFDPKEFSSLAKDLSERYPKKEAGRLISGSIEIKDGKPVVAPPIDRGIKGYRFKSNDEKEIAQFRNDGFTFSRLQPYTRWETVLDEAKRLWELYRSKTSPQAVGRIAARYINRLDLPVPIEDFGRYLTVPPELPKRLPQELSGFMIKLRIHEKDLQGDITETLVKSPKKGYIGIILDIDVYKVSVGGMTEDEIWPTFDRLRELKNRIFFGLIKEETARLFE